MVEIMTDKATVEIPTPRAGRVAKLMYAEGQICPVGKVLIAIEVRRDACAGAPAPQRRGRRARGRRAVGRTDRAGAAQQRRECARCGRARDAGHA